ncbi:MAG TPA: hypothetical protein VJI15_00315 [Candidatus Nanoarchaeia archaeon]|nr:hypothetical protein [Candidatus Nanoarchaeia archaeon]
MVFKIDPSELLKINPSEMLERCNHLNERTQALFTASDQVSLANYNNDGYFHRVDEEEWVTAMRTEWAKENRVPPSWIAKGDYPGIWLAMFSH